MNEIKIGDVNLLTCHAELHPSEIKIPVYVTVYAKGLEDCVPQIMCSTSLSWSADYAVTIEDDPKFINPHSFNVQECDKICIVSWIRKYKPFLLKLWNDEGFMSIDDIIEGFDL